MPPEYRRVGRALVAIENFEKQAPDGRQSLPTPPPSVLSSNVSEETEPRSRKSCFFGFKKFWKKPRVKNDIPDTGAEIAHESEIEPEPESEARPATEEAERQRRTQDVGVGPEPEDPLPAPQTPPSPLPQEPLADPDPVAAEVQTTPPDNVPNTPITPPRVLALQCLYSSNIHLLAVLTMHILVLCLLHVLIFLLSSIGLRFTTWIR